MPSSTALAALIAHCRKLAPRQHTPDAELLRRFVGRRDNAAFEELLERYAPLVWSACRRMVRSEADCEDAFQAVFVALVRQAGAIDPERPLGAWLHGVAVHAAHKAAARSARQPTVATLPERASTGDIADELGNRELFGIIDEEIGRLPSLLREPFVLCCLEGRTRDEAAAALGCSVAAIKSRLERSRNLLRRQLERRGIGLPAAFLVLGLTGGHVRASLRAKALHCVFGSVPATVAALAPAAGVSMASKLTLTAMSFVMIGVLGFGTLHVMETDPANRQRQLPGEAPAQPNPAANAAGSPIVDRFGDPLPPGAIRRFGTLRFRHDYPIRYLAFTSDGKQLIGGTAGRPLAVFDVATGRRQRTIGKSIGPNQYEFAISPDGKRVVGGGQGRLWDLQTGKLIREMGDWHWSSVAFSPDGKIIAATTDRGADIKLVEADTGKELVHQVLKQERSRPPKYKLKNLEFSPDGKFLAARLSELKVLKRKNNRVEVTEIPRHVWLLDAAKGSLVRTFGSPEDEISSFAFQPGTERLVAIGKVNAIRFWDVKTGKEVHRIAPGRKGETLRILRFLDGGRHCALSACEEKSETDFPLATEFLTIVNVKDGRELRRLKLREDRWVIDPTALSADGRTVAVATAGFTGGTCVSVWDVQSGVERLADAVRGGGSPLSLSADGRTLISPLGAGRAIHWDLRTGNGQIKPADPQEEEGRPIVTKEEYTLRGPRWLLVLHRKTSEMEVKSRDGSKLLRKVKWPFSYLGSSVLSPDGTHLATAIYDDDNCSVLLWAPERENEPRKLADLPSGFFRHEKLLFSHDGKRLIVSGATNNKSQPDVLWVWDVAAVKVVRKFPIQNVPDHLVLSSDDRLLIAADYLFDPAVRVWDMETGREKVTLADLLLPPVQAGKNEWNRNVAGLQLSADERFLAVVTHRGDSTGISVWDTAAWKTVRAFPWTQGKNVLQSMIFSRDGRSLFVANGNSTILEWDISGRFGRKTETPNQDRLNILWQALREKPDKAYPAAWDMVDHPAGSVPFLIEKISPVKPVEEKRVQQLLAQLDSESFAQREEASRQLLALGEQIVPLLQQALKDRPSLETKKRMEEAIEVLSRGPSLEQLRLLRALAVLEWSKRPEAVEHLRRLAGGAPSASLTQTAKAALQRR